MLVSPITAGPDYLVVEDCEFEDVGFNLSSIDSVEIRRVRITNATAAFYRTDGLVEDLEVQSTISVAVGSDSSELTIRDSRFMGGGGGVTASFSTNSVIRGSRNVFLAPNEPSYNGTTVSCTGVQGLTLHECDIQAGSEYAVYAWVDQTRTAELDLIGNYWGTTDSLEIEGLIFDQSDSDHPDYPSTADLTRVRFWPVREGSIPTERKSVGGLKGRYRRDRR